MPDLRFLNVRFNLDAPDERKIYEALFDYPAGARSQVVREALAGHLGIDNAGGKRRESHGSVLKSKQGEAEVRRSPRAGKAQFTRLTENPQKPAQEKQEEKLLEESTSELPAGAVTMKGRDVDVDEREAVKGLLSMLH